MFGIVLHTTKILSVKVFKHLDTNAYRGNDIKDSFCETPNLLHEKNDIGVMYSGLIKNKVHLSKIDNILALYLENDEEIFKKLDLEFSVIIYDKTKNKLLVGRDRFGIKPLYYYHYNDTLIISNNIKFIKEYLNLSKLENSWVYSSLTGTIYDKTTTSIKKIKKIPPAHYLKLDNGKIEIKNYWKLEKQNYGNLSLDEYVSRFKNLLVESVNNRMQNNIGSELSGGLDSSAIVGIASKITKNIYTYSHALPKNLKNIFPPYNDEDEYFNSVIKDNRIEQKHRSIVCNNIGLFNIIRNELKIQSVPINNTLPYLSNELLSRAKQDNVKTIFSGFGGDEGVSNQANFMLYMWGRNFNIYQLTKNKTNFIKQIIKSYLINNKTRIFNQEYFFLNKDFVKHNNFEDKYLEYSTKQNPNSLSDYIYYKLNENYISNRIELFQQTASYRGINYSFPLLDYKLVEFYYSIPDKYKFYNAKRRYIFKEAIKDFVPQNVLIRNSKHGATIPNVLHRFMIDYDIIYDYLQSSKNSKAREYIDIDKMISKMKLIKQLYDGNNIRANQHIFFNALMIIMYLNEDY